jgi:hypothetical protein
MRIKQKNKKNLCCLKTISHALFLCLRVLMTGVLLVSLSEQTRQDVQGFDLKNTEQDMRSFGILKKDPGFENIPLYFIPNRGQVDGEVLFYAKASRYTLWLTKEGLVFDSLKRDESTNGANLAKGRDHLSTSKYARDFSQLIFLDANKNPGVNPLKMTEHKVNHVIGNDPSQWQTDIPTFESVLYKNIYKNIDLKIYGIEKEIEYDWVVRPGGRPEDICFEYKNVKGTRLEREGNLVIAGKFGELRHRKPISYQVIGGRQIELEVEFRQVTKGKYGFRVKQYNQNYNLIIDPLVLVYSSYLGGSSSEYGSAIAVDSNGSVYVTGETSSVDFPTKKAYQRTFLGWNDAFLIKFSPDGKSLIYSTYLGGSIDDHPTSMAVDSKGAIYIFGYTSSTDYPTKNAYQKAYAGDRYDAFLTKFSPDGKSLIYSTYLGGSDSDYGYDVAVDSIGAAYVIGETWSADFPTMNPYQKNLLGYFDAFVTKFSPSGKNLEYSTYLGGSDGEYGRGIAVNKNGAAYVAGETGSTDFPTKNGFQMSNHGWQDGFVTKLSPSGKSLNYSTYLGGSDCEGVYDIFVDNKGAVYVTGETEGGGFPIKNAYQRHIHGLVDVFVTKFSPGGKSLEYSTFLGGSMFDHSYSIAVDSSGAAYITGETCSDDFPIKNALQINHRGGMDVFISKFSPSGKSLEYSTYLGGPGEERGTGIAVDNKGGVYITGITWSNNFPTKNAYQKKLHGWDDAFVIKLFYTIKSSAPH